MNFDAHPLGLTLRLAAATTAILFVLAIPFAFALTQIPLRYRMPLMALVNLPLVLPPTVLGFYLLLLFSPESALGGFLLSRFDVTLAFSFAGLLIGSLVFSLPFMMNPLVSGLESLPPSLIEESTILGASKWQTLRRVLLPEIKPAMLSGIVLTFAHTVGEFGVVLMIGGKIPGKTLTASMAVYDEVESLRYQEAHAYAAILCLMSFVSLLALFSLNKKWYKQW